MAGRVLATLTGILALLGMTATARAELSLVQLGTFSQPVLATSAPGDSERVYVVEQGGVIKVVHRDGTIGTFLDLTDRLVTGGERGLLSIAFAPDHATSGRFYVYYTGKPPYADGSGDIVIDEYRRDEMDVERGNPATRRRVLDVPHRLQGNHNGGTVAFGPDGMLYAGTGDGGGGGDPYDNGQRLDPATSDPAAGREALLGKLLRVDPAPGAGCGGGCTVPPDNPFAGQRDRAEEIWSYGLRNPFRFSFDRTTGDLTIGDVGQSAYEEVDHAPRTSGGGRGLNFGWDLYEGRHTYPGGTAVSSAPGFTFPAVEKNHGADGFCSITGGVVVRDPGLPTLGGQYVYADYCEGRLRAATLAGQTASNERDLGLAVASPAGFGEDACGRVLIAALGGPVFRLADGASDCVLQSPYPMSPATPAPAPGPSGPAGSDARAPVLTLRGATMQHLLRTGRVTVRVRCDEECRVRVAGDILVRRSTGRAAAVPAALRLTARRGSLARGATVAFALRVSRAQRRAIARVLRRRDRIVTVRLTVTATDAAGNTSRALRRIRVRR